MDYLLLGLIFMLFIGYVRLGKIAPQRYYTVGIGFFLITTRKTFSDLKIMGVVFVDKKYRWEKSLHFNF